MRKQGIYFNCKEKEHIITQCPKLKELRKYFGKKLEIKKLINKIKEEELREFIKKKMKNFSIDKK